jgi:hypothetical protein
MLKTGKETKKMHTKCNLWSTISELDFNKEVIQITPTSTPTTFPTVTDGEIVNRPLTGRMNIKTKVEAYNIVSIVLPF